MGEGRKDICRRHAEAAETALGEARFATSKTDAQRMGKIQRTGVWLSVLLSIVNDTYFRVQESRDTFFLSYNIDPPELPFYYNGCGAAFFIFHALDCKKSNLIMARHNNLCDKFADLAGKAFIPTHVRDNPKIFIGCAVRGGKSKANGKEEQPKDEMGSEGGSPNQRPLDRGDGQYSRHACRDY